jgi:hypothetical protein
MPYKTSTNHLVLSPYPMHFDHTLWLHWWFWDYGKVLPAITPKILVLLSSMTVVVSHGWHASLLPVMFYWLQMLLYCVHRDMITLGLDLFSGEYLNMLLFQWYPLIDNYSIYGAHQVRCFFVWEKKQRLFLKYRASLKKFDDRQSPKK